MLTDISSRKDIEHLLTKFYERALADDVIGFVFTDITHLNMVTHLPVITNFWEDMLLGTHNYNGNPVRIHQQIDKLTELNEQQFSRWLLLWQITVDEGFAGPIADEAKQRAGNIAKIMMAKIVQGR